MNVRALANIKKTKYNGNAPGTYSYAPSARYSHQAWLSPDNRYLYLNDELDEGDSVSLSTMYVLDLTDLNNPVTVNTVTNSSPAITHNMYTRDDLVFAANYRSGLRIFDAEDPTDPVEVAYFDTYPDDDGTSYNSLWSNYPYFPSGTVIGSDMEKGLFVWRVTLNQLALEFPDSAPDMFAPDGQPVAVDVTEQEGTLDPDSVKLFYNDGSGLQSIPLTPARGATQQYEGTLPSLSCGATVDYYVQAETTDGIVVRDPATAPSNTYSALVAYDVATTVSDDFNTDNGWTSENLGATSGDWQRAVPVDDTNWSYDPASDSDGSGMCWLTQNEFGNTDVDNGAVRLISPALDLSAGNVAVSYDYYLRLTSSGAEDRMLVEISDGSSGPWTQVALHDQDGGTSWRSHQIDAPTLSGLGINLTDTMYLRFTVNDSNPQTIVEAGLDAFAIEVIDCDPPDDIIGDITGDGLVNVQDLLALLAAWGACDGACPPACDADLDETCAVDVFDLLVLLNNWG